MFLRIACFFAYRYVRKLRHESDSDSEIDFRHFCRCTDAILCSLLQIQTLRNACAVRSQIVEGARAQAPRGPTREAPAAQESEAPWGPAALTDKHSATSLRCRGMYVQNHTTLCRGAGRRAARRKAAKTYNKSNTLVSRSF